jgi:hypothetical protein
LACGETIQCDDAGENKNVRDVMCLGIIGNSFRVYWAGDASILWSCGTRVLYGRVRTMLNAAKLPKDLRQGVWAECAKMASDIEDMVVTPNKPIAAFNQFYGVKEPKLTIMKHFGEMALVENHDRRKIRSKLENRVCFWDPHLIMHKMFFVF